MSCGSLNPSNKLACGYNALIKPESASNPVFLGFQYEDESENFVGALSAPQWAIFENDGTIRLSDSKPHYTRRAKASKEGGKIR